MEFVPSGLWPIVDLRRRSTHPRPSIRDALVLKRENVKREGVKREDVMREGVKREGVKREGVKRDQFPAFLIYWFPSFLASQFPGLPTSLPTCLLVSFLHPLRLCVFA